MRFVLTVFVFLAALPAQASQCVSALIRDINGMEIKTDQPVVGFMIPDYGPVVDYPIPQGAAVETGAEVACPPELVASIQALFDQSCITVDGRAKAAQANEQTAAAINKRCQDLYKALSKK